MHASTAYTADDGASRSGRANVQTGAILHLPLRDVVTEIPDMSVEIARRTRACWIRIRRYLRELYDQPKVALSLKTQMVKTEAIEDLLYRCSTWTLCENSAPYTTDSSPDGPAHAGCASDGTYGSSTTNRKSRSPSRPKWLRPRQSRTSCMDAVRGPFAKTPHRTRPSLASYNRGTAQEIRTSDDFVQPYP